jgi:hypothetical protein
VRYKVSSWAFAVKAIKKIKANNETDRVLIENILSTIFGAITPQWAESFGDS